MALYEQKTQFMTATMGIGGTVGAEHKDWIDIDEDDLTPYMVAQALMLQGKLIIFMDRKICDLEMKLDRLLAEQK